MWTYRALRIAWKQAAQDQDQAPVVFPRHGPRMVPRVPHDDSRRDGHAGAGAGSHAPDHIARRQRRAGGNKLAESGAAVGVSDRDAHPQHYGLVVLLAYTGLRFCHASALHWDDWDEDAGVLRVCRNQVRGKVGAITRK
jgi:hypothetical protein